MAQLKTGSTVNGEVIATQPYVDTATNTTSLGATINGAIAKTTPVDADMLPLMDSAASNVVKKLSWANIKTALGGLYAALTHTHGNITTDGKIGSTATLPIITTTAGALTTGSFGTAAGTFCQGNDSRLSDARTPTAHNHDGTYQPIDADLTAIAGLTGTTGLLRKTAADTWTLDEPVQIKKW